MDHSENRLKHLPPEDRIVYMQWLRRGLCLRKSKL
jgi:hypothetical protein